MLELWVLTTCCSRIRPMIEENLSLITVVARFANVDFFVNFQNIITIYFNKKITEANQVLNLYNVAGNVAGHPFHLLPVHLYLHTIN
jgi:hypothetical protein